MTIELGVNSTR